MIMIGEECDCICHKVKGVMHCVACCFTCPCCKKKISFRWAGDYMYGDKHDKFIKDHLVCCISNNGSEKDVDYYLEKLGMGMEKRKSTHLPTISKYVSRIPTVGEELEKIKNKKSSQVKIVD